LLIALRRQMYGVIRGKVQSFTRLSAACGLKSVVYEKFWRNIACNRLQSVMQAAAISACQRFGDATIR
jgi:hypothetical protein